MLVDKRLWIEEYRRVAFLWKCIEIKWAPSFHGVKWIMHGGLYLPHYGRLGLKYKMKIHNTILLHYRKCCENFLAKFRNLVSAKIIFLTWKYSAVSSWNSKLLPRNLVCLLYHWSWKLLTVLCHHYFGHEDREMKN